MIKVIHAVINHLLHSYSSNKKLAAATHGEREKETGTGRELEGARGMERERERERAIVMLL